MKYLQIFIILLFASVSSFSQEEGKGNNTSSNSDKFAIKISPTKPLVGSVNLGLEFKITDLHTLEFEGSLLKKSLAVISNSNEETLHYDLTVRYKRFHKKWLKADDAGVFEGLYLSAGFKYGTRNSIFQTEPLSTYGGLLDVGYSRKFKSRFIGEVFFGLAIMNFTENDLFEQEMFGRSGTRISYVF